MKNQNQIKKVKINMLEMRHTSKSLWLKAPKERFKRALLIGVEDENRETILVLFSRAEKKRGKQT